LIRKAISGIMLTLMLIGVTLTLNIHPAIASETTYAIYIRADGSIDPSTAPIQREGDIYTFTDNIEFLSIIVERNNTIIDGNGYSHRGLPPDKGLYLHQISNVTIKNLEIQRSQFGIFAEDSSNNNIYNNSIGHNQVGIYLMLSHNNTIYGNNITAHSDSGIVLVGSSNNVISGNNITGNNHGISRYFPSDSNIISGNNITNNGCGIALGGSTGELVANNTIFDNNIANNGDGIRLIFSQGNVVYGNNITRNLNGIRLFDSLSNTISGNSLMNNGDPIALPPHYLGCGIRLAISSNNNIYHNSFINNTLQIYDESWEQTYIPPSINAWDDSYPSGGNYWSDYTARYPSAQELNDSGIWDTSYIIDENNQDNYPLMEPWAPTQPCIVVDFDIAADVLNLRSKGKWITAYIQLPEGYDPSNINASTITLNGTIPPVLDPKYDFVTKSSEYLVDHNNDSILERMVKFDRATLESWIYQNVGMQHEISLTITGELTDGTLFDGTDTINVLWQGHKSPSRL